MKAWRSDPARFDAVRLRYLRRLGCAAILLLAISAAIYVVDRLERSTHIE